MAARLRRFDDLFADYSAVFCDVWGVVHNGVELYAGVADRLAALKAAGLWAILVTNAPRPAELVIKQLNQFGLDHRHFDAVATSGDATRTLIGQYTGKTLYHLGPPRDLSLYDGLGISLGPIGDAAAISCTGLFDDQSEGPEDYESVFREYIARGLPMVCSNPDVVIDRGGKRVWCAGALAQLYAALGGQVELAGKPHWPIYGLAHGMLNTLAGRDLVKADILAIGDGMNTDVRGANNYAIDCLLITDGIHASEMGGHGSPEENLVSATLCRENVDARYFLASLAAGIEGVGDSG